MKTIPPVENCTRCPRLVESRSRIVNSKGPTEAKLVFVGEGPGVAEDEKGQPFVGKSGRVLEQLCWVVGLNPRLAYYTNATRCLPPRGGKNPTKAEVRACHEYLIRELQQLQPTVIVSLGAPALSSLYQENVAVAGVMGFTLYNDELPSIPIIPTYHPAFLMRGQWNKVALVLAHLRKAQRIVEEGGLEYKMGSYYGIQTLDELRQLRDYLLSDRIKLLSLDTETCGLSWMDSELLCISFSGEEGIGFSVPLLHRGERIEYEDKKLTKKRMKEIVTGKGEPPSELEVAWREQALLYGVHKEIGMEVDPFLKVPKTVYTPEPFWEEGDWPEVLQILHEILASDVPKAGQNIGFDLRVLERRPEEKACTVATAFGFQVRNVRHDTRISSSLLQESLPANLTTLTAYWCPEIPYYEEEIAPFKSRMWELEDGKCWEYGGADADVVTRLVPQLHPLVEAQGTGWLYENVSIPLIRCATKMEERGVRIDLDYFDRLCAYHKDMLALKQKELTELVGHEVEHPTYYETIQELVFKEAGLPLTRAKVDSAKECEGCRKGGPCSPAHAATGNDHLEELNERHPHPLLSLLIEIKTLDKRYGTYLEGGKGGFQRHIRADGRIHARWNVARAETGRFSCAEPNLMNPPKGLEIDAPDYGIKSKDAIRSMFIAEPSRLVLSADWSQAELWVLAYETGDPTLLGLLEAGEDIHVFVSRRLCELGISNRFPKEAHEPELDNYEWRRKYPAIRDDAKVFTFGLSYGLTAEGAAIRLRCDVEEAGQLIEVFLTSIFPTLPQYFARITDEVLRNHGVRNQFGRQRHLAEVPILANLRYQTDLEAVIREAVNFPIQSGAHDLHSLAHIAMEHNEPLLQRCWTVLEMHDELVMEALEEGVEQTAWMVKELWENIARNTVLGDGTKLNWHTPVEVKWGRSFGDPEYVLTADGKIISLKEVAT